MKISTISFSNNKNGPALNSKNTGFLATAGIGLTMVSAMSKNRILKKNHKAFSLITCALVLFHILSVEFYKHQYKKAMKNINR